VVVSAGNDSSSLPPYPAGYPGVLSVGATSQSDALASFSNYGPWVTVYAPGENILGARYDNDSAYGSNNPGTSFSAPQVSGAVSLMLVANPALSPADVNQLVTCSADSVGTAPDGSPIQRLNVGKAVQMAVNQQTACGVIPTVGTVTVAATLDGQALSSPTSPAIRYGLVCPFRSLLGTLPSSPSANIPTGPCTLTYQGGAPPNSTFLGIAECGVSNPPSASCIQNLLPNQTLPFTIQFKSAQVLAGTAVIQAIYGGQPWSGSVNYLLSGPSGQINGTSTGPVANLSPGTYVITFLSGGPPNSTFVDVSPSSPQNLQPWGTLVFTLRFSALPMSDDFNGSSINLAKWNVVISPSGVGTIAEINQRLEMLHTAAAVNAYQGLQSRCKISGDFDVQVDFTLLNWPSQNFHTLRFAAMDLPQGPVGLVGIYRNSYNSEGYQMRAINGVVNDIIISDTSGKLRLVRVGSTVSGYYWNGAQFVLLASSPTTTVDTGFALDFSSPLITSPTNVKVAFDNFKVNSGTVSVCQ